MDDKEGRKEAYLDFIKRLNYSVYIANRLAPCRLTSSDKHGWPGPNLIWIYICSKTGNIYANYMCGSKWIQDNNILWSVVDNSDILAVRDIMGLPPGKVKRVLCPAMTI